ncbi:MAG TPA: exodeoxyribonuclease III [Fimbriimonadaceae bacterium]|nr:exodeoxyribonuclease III [Fimbriimonadaceae bacterium]
MRIATLNAAGIRPRMPLILDWLATHEPDVLAIQETKVEDDKFPLDDFEELGYHAAIHGQKSWNGVAIVSRHPIQNVRQGFGDELFPNDCRILSCETNGYKILNTYVPNGTAVGTDKWDYKLRWLERFATFLRQNYRPEEKFVWLGDVNIAPKPEDVYNSKRFFNGVGHHPDEFTRLDKILEFGLVDVFRKHHSGPGYYTYFDFVIPNSPERNLGWRIDHIYATQPLADRCVACTIDKEARMQPKPSDHTFLTAEFEDAL